MIFDVTLTKHTNGIVVRRAGKIVMYTRNTPFIMGDGDHRDHNGNFVGVLMGNTWNESTRMISYNELDTYNMLPIELASYRFDENETVLELSEPNLPTGSIEDYRINHGNYIVDVTIDGSNDDSITVHDMGSIFQVSWRYGRLNDVGNEKFTIYHEHNHDERKINYIHGNDLSMVGEIAQISILFPHNLLDNNGTPHQDIQQHLDILDLVAKELEISTYTGGTIPISHYIHSY
ncbi:hypothetical protein [Escherichia coli]|uniref:hypothetical protein n=1 Tax=Escherichia coli TaxID=562 RepID=UPI001626FA8E|nr:hypothetical protein [Escherichia coli]